MRKVQIGTCTLILGDYRDVLPTLGDVTAVIADPPYGNDYRQNAVETSSLKSIWSTRLSSVMQHRLTLHHCSLLRQL